MLELLVEEVSGRRFDDFMRAAVFGPNLMTASTFSPTDEEVRAAMGTDSNGNTIAPYRLMGAAAGGLMTNAADMSRFLSGYFEIADDGTAGPVRWPRSFFVPLPRESRSRVSRTHSTGTGTESPVRAPNRPCTTAEETRAWSPTSSWPHIAGQPCSWPRTVIEAPAY